MKAEGFYYLHENKELIYKRADDGTEADFRESPFVVAFWPVWKESRESAWRTLVEGLAAGASKDTVARLAAVWSCNDVDGQRYASRIGVTIRRHGEGWIASVPSNRSEVAPSVLEALAQLCASMGYQPSKVVGGDNPSFRDLINQYS